MQAALLAGVLTSTGSWPNILPNGSSSPWSVRTSWYCGIVLSLFSILSAADQTVRLHRLSSHRDGLANIRRLLARKGKGTRAATNGPSFRPSLLQIMTWQMPVMFLTSATVCMIVGMFLHVWSATKHMTFFDISDDNAKVSGRLYHLLYANDVPTGCNHVHGGCLYLDWRFLCGAGLSIHISQRLRI